MMRDGDDMVMVYRMPPGEWWHRGPIDFSELGNIMFFGDGATIARIEDHDEKVRAEAYRQGYEDRAAERDYDPGRGR